MTRYDPYTLLKIRDKFKSDKDKKRNRKRDEIQFQSRKKNR